MATSEMKEFLSTKGTEPADFGLDRNISDCKTPAVPTSTRRMSIGETINAKIYDWELPRLDIEGFVVDYFSYRIKQRGLEWYDAPDLPCGVQPEHEMMRVLGTIFEKKHREDFENDSEKLLANPRITFAIYQEIVQTVGNAQTATCPMSYGRLVS
uniref:BH4_2 domain-containing protein n=2 Tax=Caenorhabditis japonica TaxID=281687 RepID=A0A8R1I5Q8_CAEJA